MIGKTHGHLLRDMDSYRAILTESNFGFYEMEEILKDSIPVQVMYYNDQPILPKEDFLRLCPPDKRQRRWLYPPAYLGF